MKSLIKPGDKTIKIKSFNIRKMKITNLKRVSEGSGKGFYYEGYITTKGEKNLFRFFGSDLEILKVWLKSKYK